MQTSDMCPLMPVACACMQPLVPNYAAVNGRACTVFFDTEPYKTTVRSNVTVPRRALAVACNCCMSCNHSAVEYQSGFHGCPMQSLL